MLLNCACTVTFLQNLQFVCVDVVVVVVTFVPETINCDNIALDAAVKVFVWFRCFCFGHYCC